MIAVIIIVVVIVLFSMVFHELAHGLVAFKLGDGTAKTEGRLTLNPIKHIDPFLTVLLPVMLALLSQPIFGGARPVPVNPHALRYNEWGMALVAIAGPLVNFILAFVSYAIMHLLELPFSFNYVAMANSGEYVALFFGLGFLINAGFFAFNILPIPPLDGSRVLYAIAPDFIRSGLEVMERYGLIVVMALVILANDILAAVLVWEFQMMISWFELVLGFFK